MINKQELQKVSEALEIVLEEEGPYIMTTSDGLKTWDREVNREEMLQHHIEVAIQQINELMEGE
ncbi:hypothetical protein PGH26_13690 [Sporosarcina jeotgali]|uniref:Uncharacterized protein n=1 Tax=Sporosarcina jeotgali TaxID=3020056 RepID=A0ABZ0KU01_9BACL|nr:hypothetical protein [Sporosarcina sp. B2O-1]WOV83917.1 hypothetical protein PGH26_13690 [Sporosarcina sp. B2O-1]